MADNYVIETISDEEKQDYLNIAQLAIDNLRKKIAELQQMINDNISMPVINTSHEVAFYIKDIIGIPNRESQKDVTDGAVDESYYLRFIPINNKNIVIDLRVTDHIRGEEWSDRKDGGVHPNIRAGVIVQDTGKTTPNASVRKPHKVNGCKVKRLLQQVPTTVYGTPENVIKHLNTLICLFQNGKFGKYKNKQRLNSNTNMKTENRNRNVVRLTESKLKQIVAEELKRVLREGNVSTYNIDIHFDFAMSVPVKARNLDEAIEIVEKQIYNGTIKPTDAEPTGDYDLDTSYQPDEY